jgi:hypothetical protein
MHCRTTHRGARCQSVWPPRANSGAAGRRDTAGFREAAINKTAYVQDSCEPRIGREVQQIYEVVGGPGLSQIFDAADADGSLYDQEVVFATKPHRSRRTICRHIRPPAAPISARDTSASVIKRIGESPGLDSIGPNDPLAAPMSEDFDPNVDAWSSRGAVPSALRLTKLPLPAATNRYSAVPKHWGVYWNKPMSVQYFSEVDSVDLNGCNLALWQDPPGDETRLPGGVDRRTTSVGVTCAH